MQQEGFEKRYLQANKEYKERYMEFEKFICQVGELEEKGNVVYLNRLIFAKEFNVDPNMPCLTPRKFIEGKYQ